MQRKIYRKFKFWKHYLSNPPWDTGISPPELEAFIADHPAGRAIDLGCGTGTNVIRLAEAGWDVKGVDFVPKAIRKAIKKNNPAKDKTEFVVGDVSKSKHFNGLYDLILDIGCYHALSFEDKTNYRINVREHLAENGQFLLFTFLSDNEIEGPGLTDLDLELLKNQFSLKLREDESRGKDKKPSVWFWFEKLNSFDYNLE